MATTKRKPRPLTGSIEVVGDKSITHRCLVIGALASGPSRFTNINDGTDCAATAAAVGEFGAGVRIDDVGLSAVVEGRGLPGLREPGGVIDCGNSGTTLRMLAGVAAGIEGLTVLTGDRSLRNRPMLRLVAPLRQMGAQVDGRAHGDRPPLAIRGGSLSGLDFSLPTPSAQVKSCLLLAGLAADGPVRVASPGPSRDHTERLLAAAGARVEVDGFEVRVAPGSEPGPLDLLIPGDVSAALFFVVAALIVPGSDLTITGVGLNPTRTRALDVLTRMGGAIEVDVEQRDPEPIGTIHVRHSKLTATTLDEAEVADCIDEIPILSVAAARAEGRTEIHGARELRVKETDRIATIASALRVLGATVEVAGEALAVEGGAVLRGGEIESGGDHRIAMMGAIAGLVTEGNVKVTGWGSVDTSFPGFLDVLGKAQSRGRR